MNRARKVTWWLRAVPAMRPAEGRQFDCDHSSSLNRHDSGQALALFAVVLLGLVAMAALVLDGGFIYIARRSMQNAADAAVMAGARWLACEADFADPAPSAGAAISVARDYGEQRNGAELCTVTLDGTTLTAVCQKDVDLTFARVLGLAQTTVTARASATFGPVTALGGVAPIAIRDFEFEKGREYTIWDDVKDADPSTGDIAGSYRGWLNLPCEWPLSCGSGGASDLQQWMRSGYPGVVETNTWIRGSNGTETSVLQEASVGQLLIIPVYDTIAERYPGKDYYHIISFAAFRVAEVIATGPRKGLRGHFEALVVPGDSSGTSDTGIRAIRLTR